MKWRALLFLLVASCGTETTPTAERTGLAASVRFGSHLPIATLAFDIAWADQRIEATQGVPPHVGPPGIRSVEASVDLPDASVGSPTTVVISGRDAGGRTLGVARASIEPVRGQQVPFEVSLAAPGTCGDGVVGAEACDDGNRTEGDGCSSACEVEDGYRCTGTPSRCARCGNGRLEVNETCDDGNLVGGDGCSATCQIEGDRPASWTASEYWPALQAASTEFVSVAETTLEPSDTPVLVFLSGVVTGDDSARVDLQIRIDDEVTDRLGHQLRGAAEDAGGGLFHVRIAAGLDRSSNGQRLFECDGRNRSGARPSPGRGPAAPAGGRG